MGILLDTNIVSDLVRHPRGCAASRLAQSREETVATSIIVAAELRFGAIRLKWARLSEQLETILKTLPVLPLESPVDRVYGELRALLESKGSVIGANDMLIAAHALTLGYVLVTDNEREFARVPSLRVENWLR